MEPLTMLESMSALGFLLRATILRLGAALLSWALRKGTAGTRHLLWTAAFVALLGLPIATLGGVRWDLPVLPAETGADAVGVGQARAFRADTPTGAVRTFEPEAAAVRPVVRADRSADTPRHGVPWATLLWIVWAAGTGAALVSLLVGGLRLRGMVRRARPLRDPNWLGQAAALKRKLGIRRDVRLLTSSETVTPMTGGWQRPVVLLPASAVDWSAEKRDVVLAHELIHVRRHDALRQVLGRVALALYWFHPLSWLASRLGRASREQACDETVLTLGTRPSEYASHLLELAEGLSPAPVVLALPIVQRSQLERRIMAILRPHPVRATPVASAVVLILMTALGVSAATAHPVPVVSQEATAPSPVPEIAAEPAPVSPPSVLEPAGVPAGPDSWPEPIGVPAGPVSWPEPIGVLSGPDSWPEPIGVLAGPDSRPEPIGVPAGPDSWPEPLPLIAVLAQDASCRMEGMSGNFSGTISTRGNRTEQSGWHNGDRTIQKYVDDLRLCMRIHGEVVMDDDGLAVRAVGADSWVVLESEENELRRLVITEGSGGIEHAWTVDGRESAFGADAQAWRDQMFTVLGGYWEASRIRGQQSSLRGQISSHRGHISSLNGQISSHRGHISSLRGQASSHRGHVSSLQGEISSLRGHLSSLEGQISSYNGQLSGLRSALRSSTDAETQRRLEREVRDNEHGLRDLEQQIQDYQVEVRVQEVQRQNEQYQVEVRVQEVELQAEAYAIDERVQEVQTQIQDYQVEVRVQEVQRQNEQYQVEVRVQEVELQAEAYAIDERVQEVQTQIEEYQVEEKVLQLEREIEELDADRRAEAIEREMEAEVATLRRMIRGR